MKSKVSAIGLAPNGTYFKRVIARLERQGASRWFVDQRFLDVSALRSATRG